MWTKLTVIGCLLLTVVVVHTALRIEHLNSLSGMLLPRPIRIANEKWQVPELRYVLGYVDAQIATRRSNLFSVKHPEKVIPEQDSFIGAPYNAAEQDWINRSIEEHSAQTSLYWWIVTFGTAQYLIAPVAVVWAMANYLSIRKTPHRVASALCALLAFGAIFLMMLRGY